MIHPQPTTVLLLLASPEERLSRTPLSTRIATFLTRSRRPRRPHRARAVNGTSRVAPDPGWLLTAPAPDKAGKVHAGERHRHS